ncbi:manganese efflux pump MntP family protein [Veillonella sp. VA141]|uniref:manganese efflux pump MntP n=1 Tax=Veillonella sp. VA141 TaxID=741833 RepID=UPI000F8DE526|nr:manganese efflux pump MntP family protein [Veillonella sp. VA141]
MSYLEILILSIGLAMDAFAVSICKSSQMKDDPTYKKVLLAFLFGAFQCMMPIIGAAVGAQFSQNFDEWDHWVIFITLGYLGINMIRASLNDEEEDKTKVDWKEMLALSIATSIDALAVGVTIALLHADVLTTSVTIGVITFLVCLVGIFSGYHMMKAFRERAEMAGGVILILIGVKILLQHLGYLPR